MHWLTGVARLYGTNGLQSFTEAHVGIVGVGGVGSWAAEGLARSGIGRLTLIDMDNVERSNTNRQIQALSDNYGKPKVQVLADRIHQINPDCQVHPVERFVSTHDPGEQIPWDLTILLDAVDNPFVKAALIGELIRREVDIVIVGAAGGRRNPFEIRTGSLAQVTHDPLLARVRSLLRRQGCLAGLSVPSVYLPLLPESCAGQVKAFSGRLDCQHGLGTTVTVTACFGLMAAALILERIAAGVLNKSNTQ